MPGPVIEQTVAPRSPQLVKDYIRHVGGEPGWYKDVVPAHMFPQWGFPLFSQVLSDIPYDLTKVLNGGCRIEVHRPLPAGEPLHLKACLEEIDDNGRRAVLKQRLTTGTDSAPDALTCWLYAIVPLPKKKDAPASPRKPRPTVSDAGREIARWRLGARSGWEFALLTGDFNPVHWITPYARMAGFKNPILHGFSTLARSIEDLNRVLWAGDPSRLESIDVKFTRPLVLPATPGTYIDDDQRELAIGEARGGPAFLTGTWTTR
jgi:hypothetical protein